ncbi:MAG: cytochrome P460 family protein [Luteibacter sp.]
MSRALIALFAIAAGSLTAAIALAASAPRDDEKSPIYGVTVPKGYRHWEFIAPAHESPPLDELRVVVGNDIAVRAYREGTLPFPDGSVLVKLAWKHQPSGEFAPAYVPGAATTIQVMEKDSRKYASSGGWGFGRFVGATPVDIAQHRTCLGCHKDNVKDHDLVFTRYAQ